MILTPTDPFRGTALLQRSARRRDGRHGRARALHHAQVDGRRVRVRQRAGAVLRATVQVAQGDPEGHRAGPVWVGAASAASGRVVDSSRKVSDDNNEQSRLE